MLIDWFTALAQIVNFLILVWLLKRYLYKPILGAIDEREKRIASQLEKAAALSAEAKKERETFEGKNAEFEKQREAQSDKVAQDVKVEKQRLLEGARKEYESLRLKQSESLKNEQATLNREITRRTQSEVFAITRKTLTDLASENLEERIVKVFAGRLRDLNDEERKRLTTSAPALVRSTFELPQAQRTEIESALKATLNSEMNIHYETAPDLVSGIELTAAGNKVAWSISDYLTAMEQSISEAANEKVVKPPTVQKNRQESERHVV